MKRVLKVIGNLIMGILIAGLLAYIAAVHFFPEQLKEWLGYQTFVILTDSMEPTIPVDSLVVVRNLGDEEEIKENEIISFRVDRLGDDVIFTHYFKKKEIDETGRERYYTIAKNADRYDDYVTYREDILGTYRFHIPYAGKLVRFLQSPFALLELGLICIFLIIYRILWNKFDNEEKLLAEIVAGGNVTDSGLDKASLESESVSVIPGEESSTSIVEAEETAAVEATAEETEESCTEPEIVKGQPEIMNGQLEIRSKVLFGYRMAPSSGAFEYGSAGFSLTVELDGTVRYEEDLGKRDEKTVAVFRLGGKSLKKIKKIMKDSQLVIRSLPETLDNGFCIGRGSFFIFQGHKVTAWNIRHNNLKKVKAKDGAYYKKYKKNMRHENDVLELFKKIRNVLREEGIKISLDSVEIKAGK